MAHKNALCNHTIRPRGETAGGLVFGDPFFVYACTTLRSI